MRSIFCSPSIFTSGGSAIGRSLSRTISHIQNFKFIFLPCCDEYIGVKKSSSPCHVIFVCFICQRQIPKRPREKQRSERKRAQKTQDCPQESFRPVIGPRCFWGALSAAGFQRVLILLLSFRVLGFALLFTPQTGEWGVVAPHDKRS